MSDQLILSNAAEAAASATNAALWNVVISELSRWLLGR